MANMVVKDGAGADQYLAASGAGTDADPFVLTRSDYATEAALGNVPGRRYMTALGERDTMAVVTTGEDVWRGNELSPSPTSTTAIPTPSASGEQMTLVSEDAADNATGTGVRTIHLHYIDAAGDEQIELVTLNGTTGVNTTATDIRFVNDMHTVSNGSNGVAEGHIKIYKTGSVGLVYNMIAEGGNQSLVPHRMVPAGYKLVLKRWSCSEAQGKRAAFRIRSTDQHGVLYEGVFCFKDTQYLNRTTSGNISLYDVIPALSIIKVSAWSTAAGGEGGCSWAGELVEL